MLYLVEGKVRRTVYEVKTIAMGHFVDDEKIYRLVEADSEEYAREKFRKHFEDNSVDYSVTYRCLNIEVHGVIT